MKPPSKEMVEFLMECHERELMNVSPLKATVKYARYLLRRKMLTTNSVIDNNGRKAIVLHTTEAGRNFLNSMLEAS